METILTLNIDQNVVEGVENYAQYTQKSMSQLVEEYFLSISSGKSIINKPLGPITRQLAGIINLEKNIDHKELLAETLMEKYL